MIKTNDRRIRIIQRSSRKIFYHDGKTLRELSIKGEERISYVIQNQILEKSIENKFLVKTKVLSNEEKIKYNLDQKKKNFRT